MSARAKQAPALAPAVTPVRAVGSHVDGSAPTIESMRALGVEQAGVWVNNINEMRDLSEMLPWRDDCRDEALDYVVAGHANCDELLTAWTTAFDSVVAADAGPAVNVEEIAALRGTISDGRDNIDCALEIVRDLLRLAIDAGARFEPDGNIANAPIRAATRYLDDIQKSAAFIDGWTAEKGGAK